MSYNLEVSVARRMSKKSKDRTMPGGKMGVSLLKTALMLANS